MATPGMHRNDLHIAPQGDHDDGMDSTRDPARAALDRWIAAGHTQHVR